MRAWTTLLALLVTAPAAADPGADAPAPGEAPRDVPEDAPEAPAATADDLLRQATLLLDDRLDDAARTAAAEALAALGDPRALAFLRAAVLLDDPEIRTAAVAQAASFDHPDATALADRLARLEEAPLDVRLAAITALGRLQREDAGRALHALADARGVNARVRSTAADTFVEAYPDLSRQLDPPGNPVEPWGAATGIAANGVAVGVLLSSVGAWGQLGAGEAIGAVGGGAIGIGTGALYATTRPVTNGQGFAYASGVGWGLSAGLMAQWAAVPADHPDITDRRRRDVGALLRVLGTGAGATVGALAMRGDPDPADVLEVDLAGYTGSQIAWGVSRLALGPDERVWSAIEPVNPDEPWDLGQEEEARRTLARRDRIRTFAALGGAIAGLGAGAALRPSWELEAGDALMGGVVAAEAAWIGGWAPAALDVRKEPDGHVHTALHAGLALGLAATAFGETSPRRSLLAGYGMVSSNALGAGLPMLIARDPDDTLISRVMLPVGAAGTVGGALLSEWVDPSPGDWAMVGVGVPLAAAEGAALGSVLYQKGQLTDQQAAGLGLTLGGGSAVGLMALAHEVDADPADMALLGASAAWGTWFGVITPLAFDAELDRGDDVLVAMITADAFVAGGGLLISPLVDLEPGRTLGPQLGGVAGATLGALSMGLATDDGPTVATGALVGSVVGLGAGAVISEVVRGRGGARAGVGRPRLAGQWTPTAQPILLDDGTATLALGVQATGW